jgi:uncharacterized protein
MPITIRPVRPDELDAVLRMNNQAGPNILPLTADDLRHFMTIAHYFRVATIDETLAGFLIALTPGADYHSPNFRWFCERYPAFLYIDRVVVAPKFRGAGVGRVFYADVQSVAEQIVPLLACEVALEPRDDVSLVFHGTSGFSELGEQHIPSRQMRVALLGKELPAFAYVKARYLDQAA